MRRIDQERIGDWAEETWRNCRAFPSFETQVVRLRSATCLRKVLYRYLCAISRLPRGENGWNVIIDDLNELEATLAAEKRVKFEVVIEGRAQLVVELVVMGKRVVTPLSDDQRAKIASAINVTRYDEPMHYVCTFGY